MSVLPAQHQAMNHSETSRSVLIGDPHIGMRARCVGTRSAQALPRRLIMMRRACWSAISCGRAPPPGCCIPSVGDAASLRLVEKESGDYCRARALWALYYLTMDDSLAAALENLVALAFVSGSDGYGQEFQAVVASR